MNWKQKHAGLRERVYKASDAKSFSAFDKQVTRAATGLTTEEALFVLANKYHVGASREFAKLSPDGQQRVSSRLVQNTTVNTTTRNVKIDRRTLHINNSPIHNLSFGDRNVISQEALAIDDHLARLVVAVNKSENLSQDEKADYKSDIQTLATQVGKRSPNKKIIQAAWETLKGLATVEGCAALVTRIAPHVQSFLGS